MFIISYKSKDFIRKIGLMKVPFPSAPRARPGIHIFSRTEVHKEVRPGIQGQVEMAEPPPAYNRFQLTCGPKALYKKWPLSDFEAATTPIPESRLPDNAKSSKTTGLSMFQRIEFKYKKARLPNLCRATFTIATIVTIITMHSLFFSCTGMGE